MSEKISRRSFLKISGALVAAGALAACGGSDGGSSSTSGSGSGSSSGSGSGSGSINTGAYYDIGGLKLKTPSSFGVFRDKFFADLYFKNENNSSITLSVEDFRDCTFNDNDIKVLGFGRKLSNVQNEVTIKADGGLPVRVFFDTSVKNVSISDAINLSKKYPFTFTIVHGRQKAICSGNYNFFSGAIANVRIVSN